MNIDLNNSKQVFVPQYQNFREDVSIKAEQQTFDMDIYRINRKKRRRLIEEKKAEKYLRLNYDKEKISLKENTFFSPANGTDVLTHPIAVIKCANQTMCIQPRLELKNIYNVYYCKHVGYGVRFYFLVKEGLLLHPNINMIDDIHKAQMIVYLPVSAPWHKSECNKPEFKNKTIVLDEGDGPQLFEPDGKCWLLVI